MFPLVVVNLKLDKKIAVTVVNCVVRDMKSIRIENASTIRSVVMVVAIVVSIAVSSVAEKLIVPFLQELRKTMLFILLEIIVLYICHIVRMYR